MSPFLSGAVAETHRADLLAEACRARFANLVSRTRPSVWERARSVVTRTQAAAGSLAVMRRVDVCETC